ncbi:hypothetical protein BDV97DRAFT_418969 [Delphinella strobiligena]|nr:hypothetical protein BDV97DRAFT_418969 [Delphinella strobiligena]
MFYSTLLLAATAITGLVSAQDTDGTWSFATNYSTSGPIAINPDSVELATRESWCRAETSTCPQICGTTSSNTCNPDTLNYTCTCSSGTTPNISSYEQTLPFYICQQWVGDCVLGHPNDLDGQTACQSVICGSGNASTAQSSSSASSSASSTSSAAASSSSAAASTTSAAAASSGTGSATASSSAAATSKAAAAALSVAKTYGTGALAAGMLAVFGLAL